MELTPITTAAQQRRRTPCPNVDGEDPPQKEKNESGSPREVPLSSRCCIMESLKEGSWGCLSSRGARVAVSAGVEDPGSKASRRLPRFDDGVLHHR
jgi:hypothetical protein